MPLPLSLATARNAHKKAGLALWMERVLEECDRASVEFGADPVHDLRVALRRCRSMADGLRVMDPNPAVRRNRLWLMRRLESLMLQLADISEIVPEGDARSG